VTDKYVPPTVGFINGRFSESTGVINGRFSEFIAGIEFL